MRAFKFITGCEIYKLGCTYKFQLKTTMVTINILQFQIKPNNFFINLGKWQCGLDCQQLKFAWKTALYLSCNYIKRQIVLLICHHN